MTNAIQSCVKLFLCNNIIIFKQYCTTPIKCQSINVNLDKRCRKVPQIKMGCSKKLKDLIKNSTCNILLVNISSPLKIYILCILKPRKQLLVT